MNSFQDLVRDEKKIEPRKIAIGVFFICLILVGLGLVGYKFLFNGTFDDGNESGGKLKSRVYRMWVSISRG